jgi:hypothetical protein
MSKLLDEIRYDAGFIRSHSLQPKWYKVLKVFILLGFLLAYLGFFGWAKTVIFFTVFLGLNLLIHMLYRVKTNKYRQSWLDFTVVEQNGEIRAKSIGMYYYLMVIFNTIIALVISQVLP